MKVNIGPYPIDPRKKRKISVKLDNYDVWDVAETLSEIIVPLLKKLKQIKNGIPNVHDADLPDDIRTKYPIESSEYFNVDYDDVHMEKITARWEYVIDAMIFAFDSYKTNWESQFYLNGLLYDKQGYDDYENKILNGRILFTKYYDNLWS
ncbi:MAG: hypothetical protein NTZ20_05060 [Candidatus Levybacteria bacterium]|nr:hypothetical protein [Candidatus Levybacteria bacterium]